MNTLTLLTITTALKKTISLGSFTFTFSNWTIAVGLCVAFVFFVFAKDIFKKKFELEGKQLYIFLTIGSMIFGILSALMFALDN